MNSNLEGAVNRLCSTFQTHDERLLALTSELQVLTKELMRTRGRQHLVTVVMFIALAILALLKQLW